MASQGKYDKMMRMLAFKLSNSEEILEHGEKDLQLEYDKTCESIRKMEMEREEVMNTMLEEEWTLQEVQDWGKCWIVRITISFILLDGKFKLF